MFSYKIYLAIADCIYAHSKQTRKGPEKLHYAAHPIIVAMEIAKIFPDEDVLIAAILHDTLEDTKMPAQEIEKKYGQKVLSLVKSVSEDKDWTMSEKEKKVGWHKRKSLMLQRIKNGSNETRLIVFADTLQNLECLVQDLRRFSYAEVNALFTKPLNINVGLYRYRLEHLWQTEYFQKLCPSWIERYQEFLKEVEDAVKKNGEKIITFVPNVK